MTESAAAAAEAEAATADPSFRLARIGQIAITARNLPRAIAFYRDALGMPFLFEAPKMAFFDCGGVRLMLAEPETAEFDHPASILYYKVDDIDRAYQALAERGVVFVSPPHIAARLPDRDLRLAFLRDSENNLLALQSETPRPSR